MQVHLTFDVEVWCNSWEHLDRDFPTAFQRYVYGSDRNGYALPQTLRILNEHGLKGIFFVEPLFAARFGVRFLEEIVQLIEGAGQEVQLHLHPEWTDEITPPPIADARRKRQYLAYYTLQEQRELLAFGASLLRGAARGPIEVFRAGSYAANLDTFEALGAAGISCDSSLNRCYEISGGGVADRASAASALRVGVVTSYPITTFRDGFGRLRPAQVGACSLKEMSQALESARALGRKHFVIVSHGFEMLRPGGTEQDPVVVRRFEGLCRHLASQRHHLEVGSFPRTGVVDAVTEVPSCGLPGTAGRWAEQLQRRFA